MGLRWSFTERRGAAEPPWRCRDQVMSRAANLWHVLDMPT